MCADKFKIQLIKVMSKLKYYQKRPPQNQNALVLRNNSHIESQLTLKSAQVRVLAAIGKLQRRWE